MADYAEADEAEEQDSEEQKEGDDESDSEDEKLLEVARARFKQCIDAENEFRIKALDDLKFSAGEQWFSEDLHQRKQDGRPCLVINKMPSFIKQITNDQRQNRPSIKASPVDDKGDVETAEIMQGMIRHIEYESSADTAYDTALDSAVRMGRGFFRIITDYEDGETFDQKLIIKRIRNGLSVYLDPSHQEPDGSDAEFGFISEMLSREEYKEQYPDSEVASMQEYDAIGDTMPDWLQTDGVRVVEYFYKKCTPKRIFMLEGGTIVSEDMLPKGKNGAPDVSGLPSKIKKSRVVDVPVVCWCKLNGHEVLEHTETVFDKWIPIIPVIGEELDIDGKLDFKGVVRDAKDSQRMYNYFASTETETISQAPRSPWVGPAGSFEGFEDKWESANRRPHAYLEFNPVDFNGQQAAAPTRNSFEPAIQAATMARTSAGEDMKATTGIYDATLGNRSNEQSGVAIQRRNQQSQTSNFHFVDNLTRSLRHAGRILVRAIPRVYDTARAVRIIGDDGEHDIVRVNEVFQEGKEHKAYNLDKGTYDVAVETGPNYATKRAEAVASMLDFIKSYPAAAQLVGDLLAKNMDWPGAQEIAERLKKAVPPGIIDDGKNDPLPPGVKAQMDQMSNTVKALSEQLHKAMDQLQSKQAEMESKERIAMNQIQAEIEIAMAKMGSAESLELLRTQVAQVEARLSELHEHSVLAAEQDHAAAQSDQDRNFQASQAGPEGAASGSPTGGQTPGSSME